MSVANWFIRVKRPITCLRFQVVDLEESKEIPSRQYLSALLRDNFWGNEYLSGLARRFGWDRVHDRLIGNRWPANKTTARGDFGEAVSAEFLKCVEGYSIPIAKLRYKWTSGQTLPGVDCVAFKSVDGHITEVAFMESKYRSTLDLSVAVDAAKQLMSGIAGSNADLLAFIIRQLRKDSHELAEAVEAYALGDSEGQDVHLIALICEKGHWDDRILANLQDESIELEPLRVYVAKIDGLNNKCDSAYETLFDS